MSTVSFPLTAPGPLVPLDAPLPQIRPFRLLDAARIVNDNSRWETGAWINGYPAGEAAAHDPCADGTYRLKDADASVARPFAGSFTVVLGGTCTARSVGPSLVDYENRLRLAFQALEGEVVERVFVDGLPGSSLGAYVGDANMESLGTAVPVEALALLEKEISENGAGMIHVAPATATYWISQYLIEKQTEGGVAQMRTRLGTIVAVGAGYNGVRPDGQNPLASDEEWAFATGFVEIRRGELEIVSNRYAESLDRSDNTVTLYAERDYLITWVGREDTSDAFHTQAGVLVDRL